MTDPRRRSMLAALALAALAAPGCGSGPSCEKAVARAAELRKLDDAEIGLAIERCHAERWSEAVRGCVADADDQEELAACAAKSRRRTASGSFESYMEKSKASEAELHLKRIEKAIKTEYAETAAFPVGDAGPTPAGPCCEGPNHKCAASRAAWADQPVWTALDFEVDEPSFFQYSYHGSATHASADAVGDLDCDGINIVYHLSCDVGPDGNPVCTTTRPARAD